MRLSAALEGNLVKVLQEETRAATHGAREGIRKGTNVLKGTLRAQITRAGLGRRLANTWRGKFFDNDRGFNVTGFVYSKAQTIVRAHAEGAVIRPKRGRHLAIPTASAPRRGANPRKRISPSNWPQEKFGPLQEAKVLTEVWRREYNQVRPHSSLSYKPPAPETGSGPLSATAS